MIPSGAQVEVSTSAFYAWLKAFEDTEKTQQKAALVPKGHKRPKPASFSMAIGKSTVTGACPMHWAKGMKSGHYQVRHLMARLSLKARYPKRFKVTTNSNHNEAISPNSLDRQFEANAPNQVWSTAITYIWTLEGWLYLAVVIDLYSRQVAGWAVADHMKTSLCVTALQMAFLPAGHKGAENRNLACCIIRIVAASMPAMNTVSIWLS